MHLTDKFMVAAVGIGTSVIATAAAFAACWSIHPGSWLAVHNLDLIIEYGSVFIAPAVGLVSGSLAGIGSYKHLKSRGAPAP